MPHLPGRYWNSLAVILLLLAADRPAHSDDAKPLEEPPAVGDTARDLKLESVEGKKIRRHELPKQGPGVVVVLRGYPGYQCPLCTAQVAGLRGEVDAFRSAGANVVLVYPGSADELKERAKEFLKGGSLPAPLTLVLDPDYEFVTSYALRWDAPNETAYPSTFVIDRDNKVLFSKVSKKHGGRSKVKDVITALPKKP